MDSKLLKNLALAATVSWATVATVFSVGGLVSAQDGAVPYKIAVVDRKEVFDSYAKRESQWTVLENERKAAEEDLNKRLDGLQQRKKEYETNRDKMTEDQRTTTENELNKQLRQLQADGEAKQNEINRRGERIIKDVTGEINKVIEGIGKAGNYHLILEADTAISSVVYFANNINITPEVVKQVNAGAGAAAPAAAPAPAAAKKK